MPLSIAELSLRASELSLLLRAMQLLAEFFIHLLLCRAIWASSNSLQQNGQSLCIRLSQTFLHCNCEELVATRLSFKHLQSGSFANEQNYT